MFFRMSLRDLCSLLILTWSLGAGDTCDVRWYWGDYSSCSV